MFNDEFKRAAQRADILHRNSGKCRYCDNRAKKVVAWNNNELTNADNLTINAFFPVCDTDYRHYISTIMTKALGKDKGKAIVWELKEDGTLKEIFRA